MTEPTRPQPADLLPAVLDAVAEASTAIMEVYASSHDVEYKSDESPITRADRAAHEILARPPRGRIAPSIPVLSEEAEACHARAVRGAWRELWLVDPLDGTKEFISRNGEFTVNVALVRDHRPVLGVVAAPALGLTYYATEGGGAFRRKDGAAGRADPRATGRGPAGRGRQPLAPWRLARRGARAARRARTAARWAARSRSASSRKDRPTSTRDSARPRSGTPPRPRPCSRSQAARVTTLDGSPLRYNERDTLLNPHFMAFGDGSRPWTSLF